MNLKHIATGLVLAMATSTASAATLEEATAAVEAARQSGFYWLHTDKLLENAQQAQINKDTDKMNAFIEQVMTQAAGALAQAEAAKTAGPTF
jgi:hypothetical protein